MSAPEKLGYKWASGAPSYIVMPTDSKALVGWQKREKPAYQYMNWLFNNYDEWRDYFESSISLSSHTLGLRCNLPIFWDLSGTGDLYFESDLEISFRVGDTFVRNYIPAYDAINLNDGQVLVVNRFTTGDSYLVAGTYGSLSSGMYAIVDEVDLVDDDIENELILFRRKDVSALDDFFGVGYKELQVVPTGETYKSDSIFYLGGERFDGQRILNGENLQLYNDYGTNLTASIQGANGDAYFAGTLGVGISTPDGIAHFFEGSAGSVTSLSGTVVTLESNNSTNYQSFLSPNTATQGILWGDNNDNDVGRYLYNHSTNTMSWYTNASLRMTLDGSGNFAVDTNVLYVDAVNNRVGVNNSSPAYPLDVLGNGYFSQSAANTLVYLNRPSTSYLSGVVFQTAGSDNWSVHNTNSGHDLVVYNSYLGSQAMYYDGDTNNAYFFGTTIYLDSAGDAYAYLDRGATSNYARTVYSTAGAEKWRVGMGLSSDDYSIYNSTIAANAMTIDDTTSNVGFYGTSVAIDSSSYSYLYLDRGASTDYSRIGFMTAGSFNWAMGTQVTTTNFNLYNSSLSQDAFNINYATNEVTFDGGSVVITSDTSNVYLNLDCDFPTGRVGINFYNSGDQKWSLYQNDTSNNIYLYNAYLGSNALFIDNSTNDVTFYFDIWTNNIHPGTAGTYDLGSSSDYYDTMYAAVFQISSDERVKDILDDDISGIEIIKQLKPKMFKYKKTKDNDRIHFGFIAQEVEEIFSIENYAIVNGEKDNEESILSLSYTDFIAPVVKAIQELDENSENWKSELIKRIEKLENKF